MAGPSILHELSKNDLARLLGHVSALRTVSELLYQELQRHNLTGLIYLSSQASAACCFV